MARTLAYINQYILRKTTNHLHLSEIVCNIPRCLLRQASSNANVYAHVAVPIVGKVSQSLFENLPFMLVPRRGTHLPPSNTPTSQDTSMTIM